MYNKTMDGIYLIHKPPGWTSFDVVAKMRRVLHIKKIGHTGTLDPQASGLLIVLTGKYTKCIPYCVKNHKQYIAEFELGRSSDTEDIWGTILEEKEPKSYSKRELQEVAFTMLGSYAQVPPMYSAKKKDGKKLYEYARNGQDIQRAASLVSIDALEVIPVENNRYQMKATVSSGTYIRTLIVDFAKKLGELALMTKLERCSIEHLSLKEAIKIEEFTENSKSHSLLECMDPKYPLIEVEDPTPIYQGKKLNLNSTEDIVLLTYQQQVLAAYERETESIYHSLRGLF